MIFCSAPPSCPYAFLSPCALPLAGPSLPRPFSSFLSPHTASLFPQGAFERSRGGEKTYRQRRFCPAGRSLNPEDDSKVKQENTDGISARASVRAQRPCVFDDTAHRWGCTSSLWRCQRPSAFAGMSFQRTARVVRGTLPLNSERVGQDRKGEPVDSAPRPFRGRKTTMACVPPHKYCHSQAGTRRSA